jgi:hypothetical protein
MTILNHWLLNKIRDNILTNNFFWQCCVSKTFPDIDLASYFGSFRIQIQICNTGSWVKKVFFSIFLYDEPVLRLISSSGGSKNVKYRQKYSKRVIVKFFIHFNSCFSYSWIIKIFVEKTFFEILFPSWRFYITFSNYLTLISTEKLKNTISLKNVK